MLCKQPSMKCGRCKMHGGKSTGPKTQAGKEKSKMNALKQGYFTKAERDTWDKIRTLQNAIGDLEKVYRKQLPKIRAQLCRILGDKEPISEAEMQEAVTLLVERQEAQLTLDKITSEISSNEFLAKANFLQKIRMMELVLRAQRVSLQSIQARLEICDLKRISEAQSDEAFFCKPLASSLDPKYWRPYRM